MDAILARGWSRALYQNHRPRLRGVKAPGQVIALTFDDGPKPWGTPLVLDALERHNARATFFLVGKQCARFPALVARIAADGDEIGNHTYSHHRLTSLSFSQVAQELEQNRALIRRLTGQTMYLFRPPGGRTCPVAQTVADSLGYTTVFWSLDSAELAPGMNPDRVYDRVANRVQNGDIVLLHNGDPNIVRALPRILDNLAERGFQCVTVSDLLKMTGEDPDSARLQPGNDTDDTE